MILNLKRLNQNVIAPRFRYENLDTLQGNLHPGDWCSSLDLKNGFFHLPVHRDSRTYLGFQFEGNFYQYRVLPFGLSVSPWAFTKAMREVLKHIRTTMECRATTYVDDWLLIAASQRQCAEIAERVCELFRKLQLNVNMEKSTIIPTQRISYLGMILDMTGNHTLVKVPADKMRNIRRATSRLLQMAKKGPVPARAVAHVAGRITAVTRAIAPARLMLRAVYKDLGAARSWSATVSLSHQAQTDLNLFLERIQNWNGNHLSTPDPDITVTTDVSDYGWGMTTSSGTTARGFWSRPATMHITEKELTAVLLALRTLRRAEPQLVQNKTILVKSDSIATVCQLNKLGGKSEALTMVTRRINALTRDIKATITAQHMPGVQNLEADRLSRMRDPSNWSLNQSIFTTINKELGPHDIDRFANSQNTQLPPVQLPMVRRRDRSSERATAELDRDHQLCQPAVSSSAEGSAAHRAPGRNCDRDCSHMADSTLVPDFDADGSCATNDNPESPSVISGSIEPSFSTARAPQESEVGPRRMEGLWRQQAAPSIPDNVLQLMCASVAPETLARYQQIIVSLTNYCGGIHCLDAASVSGFLEFTTRSTERPEATLRLVRAAISFLADLQGRPAPDAAVVRCVHTALVATRTTKPRQATPVADVSMLVTYLKDLGSTEELPINELRQKAITLLSVTAFCRPSDLACVARPSVLPDTARGTTNLSVCSRFRMDSIKWIDEGAELVFFGSKADKGMSGNTVLIERASDPDICPITILKAYINATATARLSVDDQPVFLTLKKPYKGLSSSAIAQILSQVLKDSGQQQGVTARSIRPTGARKAIEQGVEATVVQRRGRWKSSDVFHRHYAGVTGPATDAVLNN